jgi:hypothetical protein
MTDQREVWNAKISVLLHIALVRIRSWTESQMSELDERSRIEEINHLSDLLHNLPLYTAGLDEGALDSLESLRIMMIQHIQLFYPEFDPVQHRYVQLLDMPDEIFWSAYRDRNWSVLNTAQPAHS